jgi:F-type H+-transporting ATPase subunit delta
MQQHDIPVLETYADALLAAARQRGELDRIFEEAGQVLRLLLDEPRLERFLQVPALSKEEKKKVLRRIFADQLSPVMMNLPLLLVDNNRGGLWDEILTYFIEQVEKERGVVNAQVATARPLPADLKERLKKSLEKFTGKQLRISYREDPNLLGGVLFRYDDVLIDTTLRSALTDLRNRLQNLKVDRTESSFLERI